MKYIVYIITTPDEGYSEAHDEGIQNALMTLFEAFGYEVTVEMGYEEIDDEENK